MSKRICFDLDGTLCEGWPYSEAQPKEGAAALLTSLRLQGHTVIIHTARKMATAKGNPGEALALIGALTFKQLEDWGFRYDEIYFGKPNADLYIDDKACSNVDLDYLRELFESRVV